jgi:uncharacterized cupin superfamily protein
MTVAPGQAASPYHFHLAEEEALIVLSGRPRLRTEEGWRDLSEGEVVAFPVGEQLPISSSTPGRRRCGSWR